jgi:ribosome-binding factor A
MANNRLARTNDDIQRVLSELLRNVKDPRVQQGMISITRVETTGDLRYAKVWISVYGLKNEKELRRGLKSASPWLRRELAGAMTLRYTPELVFELDHSIEYGAHISSMIRDLVPPDENMPADEPVSDPDQEGL